MGRVFAAAAAILVQRQFFGSIGFVFLTDIVLRFADSANEGE